MTPEEWEALSELSEEEVAELKKEKK